MFLSILSSKEKASISSSPFCISILEKSILFLFILAGVPVLNLTRFIPRAFSLSDSLIAGKTPSGPLSNEFSPINTFPFKYVPVAKITASTSYTAPIFVVTDFIFPFLTSISMISACFKYNFFCFSSVCFISI